MDIFEEVNGYMPDGVEVEHGLQVAQGQSCTGVLLHHPDIEGSCFFSVDELRRMADESEKLGKR